MTTKKTEQKGLSYIQTSLKAHKGQTNKFGGYQYRSCEDILEAVKPYLLELDGTLIISDEMVAVDGRHYVKATATLTVTGLEPYAATGFAREALSKKGMDEAQITGAASSYARKYALNGLLAIDDTKDADFGDNAPVKEAHPHVDHAKQADDIMKQLSACDTVEALQQTWIQHANTIKNLPQEWTETVTACKNTVKGALVKAEATILD